MQYTWILDVLTDLRTFAMANGLPALAEQLDDTSLVAATEIAQTIAEAPGGAGLNANEAAWLHFGATAGDNA
ncbi:hypothetical protein LX70_02324 [Defluviimonas denitrificans]|jgi:hypothetical protein|uniref:Uncharacterized protein n=1 Tax=Albidovulum denitrificans TaxID=404881 RepID=A0A2S8S7I7_9RHOB|nr:hypothetical protein [Defluviimonas denitrificans]PQV56750.1 hypothetical protein LX70_02324 [Defluviimonas denitrificans]